MKTLDENKLMDTQGGFIDILLVLSCSYLFYQAMKSQGYLSVKYLGWS